MLWFILTFLGGFILGGTLYRVLFSKAFAFFFAAKGYNEEAIQREVETLDMYIREGRYLRKRS